jgi:branched-chain amino acid transport system permease protein
MELLAQCFVDAVLLGGLYCLMAIGLSLAYGVTRIINFAHGEFVMLGAYGAYIASTSFGVDPLVSLPVVMIVVSGIAFVVFKLCVERVLDAPHYNQILLLFALGLVIQNVIAFIMTGDERSVSTNYSLDA